MAFADPPYPGCAHIYSRPGTPEYHPEAMRWDDPQAHIGLMADLEREYHDGWALSTHSSALRELLAGAPPAARVGVYAKLGAPTRWVGRDGDVASVSFMWEPVIYRVPFVSRHVGHSAPDWCAGATGFRNTDAFMGAKPLVFSLWLFGLLRIGAHPDDELVDLFPGSGAVTRAWDDYRAARVRRAGVVQRAMFEGRP